MQELANMVVSKKEAEFTSWTAAARAAGLGSRTLRNASLGKRPSLRTFGKVSAWLGLGPTKTSELLMEIADV